MARTNCCMYLSNHSNTDCVPVVILFIIIMPYRHTVSLEPSEWVSWVKQLPGFWIPADQVRVETEEKRGRGSTKQKGWFGCSHPSNTTISTGWSCWWENSQSLLRMRCLFNYARTHKGCIIILIDTCFMTDATWPKDNLDRCHDESVLKTRWLNSEGQ